MDILTIIGARPQLVKAGVVSREMSRRTGLREIILHTGQHYDKAMSAQIMDELELPAPHYNLGISGLSHGAMTGRMLEQIEAIILDERPDVVLVYGDTNSTIAGALAAAKLHVPVAHVEAGLRSFNRHMPEELNRILTDQLSTLLFCPTHSSARQLAREGSEKGVYVVGDVMYDAMLAAKRHVGHRSDILGRLGLNGVCYAVATVHRAENTDTAEALAKVVTWLEEQAERLNVILPLHPRTRAKMQKHGLSWDRVQAIEPIGYLDMTRLLMDAEEVFTDSGGLQKEAYFHRVSCVTLRSETEWGETIEAGWNRLWQTEGYAPRRDIDAFGSGRSAAKITDILVGFGAS